jgi:hypothetical protein
MEDDMDNEHGKTQAEPSRATWAGCLLVLATVAVSLPAGIALTMWAAPSVGPLVARFVNADSPDFVKAIAGIVTYSPIVLLGLGFYYLGASLLQYCGIELWERASDSDRRDDHPSHDVIDHLVFTEELNRFTIHKSSGEHWTGLIFCLICVPGFSLISMFIAASELSRPGKLGKEMIEEFFPNAVNLQNTLHWAMSCMLSWGSALVVGALACFCFRSAYRVIRYGKVAWVLDRERDVFCYGANPIRSLSSIDSVLISRVPYKLGFKYYVVFAPEKKPVADTFLIGLRDDVFPMSGEQTAQQFSERLSGFLGVRVEKAFK